MIRAEDFFDLSQTEHASLFEGTDYVWDAIKNIEAYIHHRFATDLKPNAGSISLNSSIVLGNDPVFIGEGTTIEPGVMIVGPAIIGRNCEIRQGAYLRENVILGDSVVVGHTSELKNALMLDGAHAPHFAYIGDSLLGSRVNLGAGSKLSNLAINSTKDKVTKKRPTVTIIVDGQRVDTGLSKIGAILGDDVQLGCNCVTNPGCLIGPRALVYPLVSLPKGYYPGDSIIKLKQQFEIAPRLS